jgi:phage terminase Nu1 subunit (DNA packaging protein)
MDDFLIGIEAVAKHFGVTVRTVYRWQREGMPRLSQNRYDPLQIKEWQERQRGILRPAGPGWVDPKQMTFGDVGSKVGKDFHEERLKKAQADKAEMETAKLRAELAEVKLFYREFEIRITALKQGLLTVSRGLPPQLIHCKSEREMEIIIATAVHEFLKAFCRPLPAALGGAAIEVEEIQRLAQGGGNAFS